MRKIDTKFGTIYIEDLEYDHHNPAGREEIDRIKVFDSLQRYMDVWTTDYFMGEMDYSGQTEQEVYQHLVERYEQTDDIWEVCPDIRFKTQDLEKMALFMQADGYLDIEGQEIVAMIFNTDSRSLEELVLSNDYVNKIGDWYILIEEY